VLCFVFHLFDLVLFFAKFGKRSLTLMQSPWLTKLI